MDILSNLQANKRKHKRIRGRGIGSGRGKTSGRGHKGSGQRTGGGHLHPGFEGGQMPLMRRTPKRGFNNKSFSTRYQVVNLKDLGVFAENEAVNAETLFKKGIIKKIKVPVKILAVGELKHPLAIKVSRASKKAIEKISKAKGSLEVV